MTVTILKILGCGLRAAVLVIAATDLLGGTPTAQAADWPQWRGPNRDGISIEKDWTTKWPAKGPKLLRQAPVGGGEIWQYSWKWGGYTVATPLVHGDRVLFTGFPRKSFSVMLQLTPSGPKEIWKNAEIGLLFQSGVLVVGHVYGPHSIAGQAESTVLRCVSWDEQHQRHRHEPREGQPDEVVHHPLALLRRTLRISCRAGWYSFDPRKTRKPARSTASGCSAWYSGYTRCLSAPPVCPSSSEEAARRASGWPARAAVARAPTERGTIWHRRAIQSLGPTYPRSIRPTR